LRRQSRCGKSNFLTPPASGQTGTTGLAEFTRMAVVGVALCCLFAKVIALGWLLEVSDQRACLEY
jgi:hypothetical protein